MRTRTGPNATSSSKLNFKEYLEIVGRLAIGFTTFCYLVGFLVVNIHLRRFGSFSAGLLSAQYLGAGLLALLPIASGWFFVLLLARDQMETTPKISNGVVWVVVIVGTTGSLLILSVYGEKIAQIPFALRCIVFIVTGFFNIIPALVLFWWLTPRESLSKSWLALTFLLACFTAIFMFTYIWAFSRSLYGDISATAGGGKPRVVRLVPKADARKDLELAGVRFSSEKDASDPLHLLLTTDKEYIFVTAHGDSSFSIPMDTVRVMMYDNR